MVSVDDRRVRRGKARNRYTVRAARDVVEADAVAELHGGRVAAVETRGFWRDFAETSDGACNQGYHWNCNGASYFFIGTAAEIRRASCRERV